MSDHSKLAPSSASRRMQCPGSRELQEKYPEAEDNQERIDGEIAHHHLANLLRGIPIPSDVSDEMHDSIMVFVDSLPPLQGADVHIEERLTMHKIHPEAFGTPDFWAWLPDTQTLDVRDYKHGHGFVSEYCNWQLLMYAIGAIEHEEKTFRRFTIDGDFKIRLTIVQPRCFMSERGPVRSSEITSKELREFFLPKLIENSAIAMGDKLVTETGPECANCSAAHACGTLQLAAYNVIKVVGRGQTFDLPSNIIGREMKLMNDCMEALKARQKALEAEMIARIKQGEILTGWNLEQGYGRQKWTIPVNEVVEMAAMMGVDVSVKDALTPVQAIKKGFAKELVDSISERPKGEVKLVPFKGISNFKG